MSYQPLHQKYRPQTLSELVGQETIVTMLTNALRQQRIAPAYLFTGSRGTGKTSTARILAKSLNCLEFANPTPEPCGVCNACNAIARGSALDVVEIDAASNTGVDNMRELIGQSHFQPMLYRYKVYCVDEAHMLSTAAFNALLKTLEEPPARVVFILATTDPQRLLPTIISRCQQFDFQRIPVSTIVRHLHSIAAQEAIDVTQAALTLVAQSAQGGLRDAETLLDQLSLIGETITPEHVWQVSGGLREPDLLAVLTAVLQPDDSDPLEALRRLYDQGRPPLAIVEGLLRCLTDLQQLHTTGLTERLYASLPTTVAQLSTLAPRVNVPQLQWLSFQLTAAVALMRQSDQPLLYLERCVLDLATAVEETAAEGSPVPLNLNALWHQIVEQAPPNLHRLLRTVKLMALANNVATLAAPTPVSAAAARSYSPVIRNGFQALGYAVSINVQTTPKTTD